MLSIIHPKFHQQLYKIACILIIPAFLYSKALITICIILFCLLGMIEYTNKKALTFTKHPEYYLFILVFIGLIISGMNSNNTPVWLHAITIKLPFVLLPFAFFFLPRIEKKWLFTIHAWLLATLVISALPQSIFIFQHQESLLHKLGMGQPIPTPLEHVKYSMFNAYGVTSACYWILFGTGISKLQKKMLTLGAGILFVFMHLLAVRTGLVIAYFSLLLLGSIYAWQKSDLKIGLLLFSAIIILPFLAYSQVPFIQQKIHYMIYDWQMFQNGTGGNYSDSQRWIMLETASDLWRQHPISGVGIGDLRDVCITYYQDNLGISSLYKLPHNQFLITLAGSGIIGLIFFIIGFYGPVLRNKGTIRLLLFVLYINYTLSFLVENSLERSTSVAFFLFFALMTISTKSSKL